MGEVEAGVSVEVRDWGGGIWGFGEWDGDGDGSRDGDVEWGMIEGRKGLGEERKGEREKGRKGEREKGRKGEREKGRKRRTGCVYVYIRGIYRDERVFGWDVDIKEISIFAENSKYVT